MDLEVTITKEEIQANNSPSNLLMLRQCITTITHNHSKNLSEKLIHLPIISLAHLITSTNKSPLLRGQ